ncbi:hypothetical protein OCU04_000387 [Sclerotinia nivalis]|uniref:Uncharacterized protein n=1 Tax=Sclerotinia nivalis TaxID=352851 RepID=A0A9X0AX09_9HELO|nr:hypothetical protein OCU04_000387 [Sclerotinia nivalis]
MHRVIRILLNTFMISHYPASLTLDQYLVSTRSIKTSVQDICGFSAPSLNCKDTTRQRLPASDSNQLSTTRDHTSSHELYCCALSFSLYVAGPSNATFGARPEVIEQIFHMGDHFRI